MTSSFAQLKSNRNKAVAALKEEIQKADTKGESRSDDDRFWQPEVDKSGNGYAVIRFLPAPRGETVPWVRIWRHAFKGPGGWYIENSLTTLGQNDPVGEFNTELWNKSPNTKDDIWKKQAREQKRKLTYIANILVVNDPANPENNGKVFLYKFGKKIFDKINALMYPEFQDEEEVNPFDFWEGCDFKLKIRNVEGYRNYDKSEFAKPSKIADTDEEIEKIWNKQYSLQAFVAPDQFKSYADLKARLERTLQSKSEPKRVEEDTEEEEDFRPVAPPRGKTAKAKSDDDDGMDFFRNLAEDDE